MSHLAYLNKFHNAHLLTIALCVLFIPVSNTWAQSLELTGDPNFSLIDPSSYYDDNCPSERSFGTFQISVPGSSNFSAKPSVRLEPNESSSAFRLDSSNCNTELNPGENCNVTVELLTIPDNEVMLVTEYSYVLDSNPSNFIEENETGPSVTFIVSSLYCDMIAGYDFDPPELVSFTLSPDSVDVTSAEKQVNISISLYDDSGVGTVGAITFVGPSGDNIVSSVPTPTNLSYESFNQDYTATVRFPQGTEPGDWVAQSFNVNDDLSNSGAVLPEEVNASGIVSVANNTDITPPRLLSLSFLPTAIDTTTSAADVVLRYSVSDEFSGISGGAGLQFSSPDGQVISASSVEVSRAGEPEEVTFEAVFKFPQNSESGIWALNSFVLYDRAYNDTYVDPQDEFLQYELAVTSDTDTTPPALLSLIITPLTINTTPGTEDVEIELTLNDDLSGVADASNFSFTGPNGQVVAGKQSGAPRSGLQDNIVYQATFKFPQFSEAGIWSLDPIIVTDVAGNQGAVGADSYSIFIDNTDPPLEQQVTMLAARMEVQESAGSVEVVLELLGDLDGSVTALVVTEPQTSDDFTAVNRSSPRAVTWEEGDARTQTLFIPINDDLIPEPDESFDVRIINAFSEYEDEYGDQSITVLSDTTTVVIERNDFLDAPISFEFETRFEPVTIGSEALYSSIRVSNSAPYSYAFSMPPAFTIGSLFSISGGSCTTLPSGLLLGNTSCELTVQFKPDVVGTSTDTVTLQLQDQITGDLEVETIELAYTGIVTAAPKPGFLQMAQTQIVLKESDGSFSVGVVRVGGSDGEISIDYEFSKNSAVMGEDFTGSNGTLVFADGDDETQFISGAVLTDQIEEGSETFLIRLTSASPLEVLGDDSMLDVVITIEDEFDPPVVPMPGQVQFVQDSVTVGEGDDAVAIVVRRVGGDDGRVSVMLDTNAGTASSGLDYTNTTQMLQWDDGDTSTRTVSIGILSDQDTEDTEAFTVTLTNQQPNSQVLGTPNILTVFITHVPPPVVLQPGTIQFIDAELSIREDSGSVSLSVVRDGGSDGSAQVDYGTVPGSAQSDQDFTSTSGTLLWRDGETGVKTITVDLFVDELDEGQESFTVQLSNPNGSIPGLFLGPLDASSVSLIDVPVIRTGRVMVVSTQVAVAELTGSAYVFVERIGGNQGELSIEYTTVDGSAIAAEDYTSVSGVLSWGDGESGARRIEVPITPDTRPEPTEALRLILRNPISSIPQLDDVLLGASEAIISVEDSTRPGVLRFVETDVSVAESDGEVVLRVVREGGSDGTATVQYRFKGDTASAGDDFVAEDGELMWASGESGEKIIRIEVRQDTQLEANEMFTVMLSDALPLGDDDQLVGDKAVVTLTDSTEAGELLVLQSAIIVDEADDEIVIPVERRSGTAGSVQLDVTAGEGVASAGVDYQLETSELVWADGEAGIRQIRLRILDDDDNEPDEQFTVQLALSDSGSTDASRVNLNLTSVSVLIQDNDEFDPQDDRRDPLFTDTGSYRLRVIGGDNQIGNPGEEIEPIVIEVVDTSREGEPVPGIQVRWRVIPEGSVEFLEGFDAVANDEGRVSFRVRVIESGFSTLIASIDSAQEPRMIQPDVAVGANEIAIAVRAGLVASLGLGKNQVATADALDQVCEILEERVDSGEGVVTPAQQDLFNTCVELRLQLDDSRLGTSLDRLAAEELFALDDSIIQISDIQITNIYSRLNAIRSGRAETWDVSGLQLQIYDEKIPGSVVNAAQNALSGGSASADSFAGTRLGTFANGSLSYGEVDGKGRQRNGNIQTRGLTVGLDYRATNQLVYGAGFGVAKTVTDFNGNDGGLEVNSLSATLFGTWYEPREGYIDAVLDIGRNEFISNRRVNLPDTVAQFARGSTDADVVALSVGFGRDFNVGGWEFGPYGRASIVRAKVDGFSETTIDTVRGFGSALDVSDRKIRSLAVSVGGQISRTINTKRAVFLPQIRIELETENKQNKDPITAVFLSDPSNTAFQIEGNDRDRTHFNIGLGSSFILRKGRSGYVFYETQAQNSLITRHWLKLGVRLEF